MDKEDVVHVHSGILLSHEKNKTFSATTWRNLKAVILSEISQTDKDKCHVISFIHGL